jgi:hypothetical protein
MRFVITAVVAFVLMGTVATASQASPSHHPGLRKAERHYRIVYGNARDAFGPAAVGRNFVVDGYNTKNGARDATRRELGRSMVTLRAMLYPPEPVVEVEVSPEYTSEAEYTEPEPEYVEPAEPEYSSGGYSIPGYIVECESGGDYGAVNPESGAGGAYQIMPETWEAYGGSGAPQDASPAEQDAIAAQIYADSGGSAWVCAE